MCGVKKKRKDNAEAQRARRFAEGKNRLRLVGGGEGADGGEELIEGGAVEEMAAENDDLDFAGVADVVEGIGVEEDEVGELSFFDGAGIFFGVEKSGVAFGGGLQ